MPVQREAPRDYHRIFGMLLIDFFRRSPYVVDVERDMSQQQQFLDVVIVRRGRGRFTERLPDGLNDLVEHNLITFKSQHEALDDWAMKELIGNYVAYRKLVSPSPSQMLPTDHFRLYAVCVRFPHNLSGQVPWHNRQAGVYDCSWGTDTVRVIVAGQLPRETHNAPLLVFSASRESVEFAERAYPRRSENTSLLLGQLFERFQREGLVMSYTMEDFKLDYINEHFPELPLEKQRQVLESLTVERRRELLQSLSPEQRQELLQSLMSERRRELFQSLSPEQLRELLQSLPAEERLADLPVEVRLAGLSPEQIRQYLEQLTANRPSTQRKPKRKR